MASIKFLTPYEVLPLRSLVLRNGLPEKDCLNACDLLESTFHLGLVDEATSEITCILTCMEENHKNVPSDAYRLRGMATNPKYRRQGHAKRLLEFAMEYLKKEKGMNYLWFNARVIAFPFYEAMGFEYMSEEFELEGIGPHREMFKFFGERESGAVETGDVVLLNENE